MPRALIVKELRETAGIVLLALLAYVYFVTDLMGIELPLLQRGGGEIPFVGGAFLAAFVLVSGGLALALGFRQSVGESARGTYVLLLHRPQSRRRLIGTKLLTGATVYLVLSMLPIMAYGWWAATPGTHASPFEWSMTVPAWKVWISLLLLYLGSFLSGLRPARWKATRLMPLAAAGLMIWLLQFVPWLMVFVAAVVLLGSAMVTNIFFLSRERDY